MSNSDANNSKKKYYEVKIFGDIYKLVSNENDIEMLKHTAKEVDKQMKMIAERYPNLPKYKISILVALNLTDTLLKEEMEDKQDTAYDLSGMSENEIVMRIEKMIDDIDSVL